MSSALASTNIRYWSTVFPVVCAELGRWREAATAIPDPAARALALNKLQAERFNVQLAGTFATLAPPSERRRVAVANVALQVLYDYLDVLEERSHAPQEPLARALIDAVGLDPIEIDRPAVDRDLYVRRLAEVVRETLAALPAAGAVNDAVRRAAERCASAQTHGHAATGDGARARHAEAELCRWARSRARDSGLGWPEWLAGAQASVLCMHALIAAAADPRTTRADAARLDALYLSIGALTMLDSLIDRVEDAAAGERGYRRFYQSSEEMGLALAHAARQATRQAQAMPRSSRHLTILVGVVAYYASAPPATSASARTVMERVRAELGGEIVPAVALMRAWRALKRGGRAFERN